MKRVVAVVVLAALIGAGAWYAFRKPEAVRTTVRVVGTENMWNSVVLVADEKGYFAEEGIAVEATYVGLGKLAMDALLSGDAEFGTVVEVNVAYLGYSGGDDIKVFGSVTEATSSAIVARRSRGVSSPADLAGKKVAMTPGTTSEIFADRFLARHNVPAGDVRYVTLQPPAMQAALSEGQVDAASLWEPNAYNTKKALGDDAIVFRDKDAYTGYLLIAGRAEWAAEHPDETRAFLRALRRAATYIRQNPEDAQAVVARRTRQDLAPVKAAWELHAFRLALDAPVLTDATVRVGEWIRRSQPAFRDKPAPDYAAYFDGSYLPPDAP